MNHSKNILYKASGLVLFATLILTQSCKKSFLDVPRQAQQPAAQFWQTGDDAKAAVSATYANLHEWTNIAFAPMAIESVGSDDTEKGSSATDATFMNDYDNFTVTAGQGQLGDFWGGEYKTINFANQVITRVPAIEMDANLKARYIAECKFIRAYAYFRLVRAFGDVPLRLAPPKDASEYNIPRTAKAQIWAAIETDLTDAAAVLPQSYGAADVGRITKGAALSLHAKAAMYQQKWADVLSFTNQVKGLGYTLFPDYEQMFRTNNENNSESVFEIQSDLIPGNPDASNSQYSQIQGVRGSIGGGWGFNVPTQNLADAFEPGDPRRDASIIFRGETTPEGDAIPATGDNPMYNQKSYVPFGMFVTGYNEGVQQNIRVIRYADVLLMNAEAANELGDATTALADLELVRARARGSNAAILPKVTTTDKDALRTAIWKERRVELSQEYDRYFDVIRQGRGLAVFGPKGWKANKNEVWPIPQNEIDLSFGVLTQNQGYN
ncbi:MULTISPECIES: RagB/SusD family nutrient uptake outer membrane protein [unclassified Mucilaginibacter]|uniref:RagB/SusD family nutrient uptake outer membrane protein n=1 Tax=unclassified Mucilaginibacter TaxID=2617802 RepID=UPI002AC9242B|nr:MULTISPECIES: RagB/SusD family nutrient uptake outer membrane protein [unclassified Mucilaginibacter]MEB0248982.1 RagB/SusD family nutrient uptake outer membrane protein [Mucilaginibacter sp. 5B2]MEB0262755.1 RagB/SusD family nutrient uptake outer membrane protein [Mucilaginibacter sp. 10I4]MEB0280181.1 RagB/SusD family nutrient uptake outer membrane protein [Mucilaginibacter sp. 10B2]MEB0303033.1 RagB/SusD family nutrient uptake outer membrane protein [Mucilaginibacter sp. 5C4]WPX24410.1 R